MQEQAAALRPALIILDVMMPKLDGLEVCRRLRGDVTFETRLPQYDERDDVERGFLDLPDRQGQVQRFPRVSIALGVATTEQRGHGDHRELVEVATEMKAFLKRCDRRFSDAIDGRTEAADGPSAAER